MARSSITADQVSTTTSTTTVIDSSNKGKSSLRPPNVDHLIRKEERVYKQSRSTSSSLGDDDDSSSSSQQEDLVFEGTFEYESELLPLSTTSSPNALHSFFLNPKNRDLVIKGGGNPIETIPPSQELYDAWTSQSQVVDSTPPNGRRMKKYWPCIVM